MQSILWSHILPASKGLLIKLPVTITLAIDEMLSNGPDTLHAIFLTITTTLQGKQCYCYGGGNRGKEVRQLAHRHTIIQIH